MTAILTAAAARKMTPAALIEQLDQLPPLDLLRGLPVQVVEALPDEVLTWRREKLLASRKPMTGGQVREAIGVGDKHFQRLRTNYLAAGVEGFDALPAPDEELSDDDIRRPGDNSKSRRSGSPRWTLGDIVRWTIERERVDPDRRGNLTLILRPGGRKPPGRTPAPKLPEQRAEQVPAAAAA
jgi:hypothetical protein